MRPHLVKNKILLDLIKKNNQQRKIFLLEKNTYFFNFVLFSIILFGLLFLVYKYIDKIQKQKVKERKKEKNSLSLRKNITSSQALQHSQKPTSSNNNSNEHSLPTSNVSMSNMTTPRQMTEKEKEINDLISSYSKLLENPTDH